MSMDITVQDASGAGGAGVDTSDFALRVTGVASAQALGADGNPKVAAYSPPNSFEADGGSVTTSVLQRQGDISANYRQRMGVDNLIFNDLFNGGAQNTSLWNLNLTTFAAAFANGFVVLNSGSVLTASAVARLQTYRGFPAFGAYPLQLEIEAVLTATAVANYTAELGFGFATGITTPTDGAYFRYQSDGTFRCVTNFNGTENVSAALAAPAANARHHYILVIGNDFVEFWIDNILYQNMPVPSGNALALMNQNPPVLLRAYNSASAPATAVQLKVAQVTVSVGDMNQSKQWPSVAAGMGGHCSQGQTGMTQGQTTQWANSANPTAAVPTNTTAALGSGLGGLFLETATAALGTDLIIASYQVPAAAPGSPQKTLYITRITLNSAVNAAITGGAYTAMWFAAYGHTAVSLATAEGAASKAPRHLALGTQAVAASAALGSNLPGFDIDLATPLVVQPGEFIQICHRKVGTVATAGSILHSISVGGYWE